MNSNPPDRNQATPQATPHVGGLPRAVWVGGGTLALVTAALAGALVMKIATPASTAVAAALPQPALSAARPAPLAPTDEVPRTLAPVQPALPPTPERTASPSAEAQPVPAVQGRAPAERSRTASTQRAQTTQAAGERPAPAGCRSCGTVESLRVVKVKGDGSGIGAVGGGVLGGVVGNQIGGGNGRTAMTVLGAIGGGLAGNEVEKRVRSETRYDVEVRMRDGTHQVVRQNQPVAVGTRVVIEKGQLRVQG